MLKKEEVIQVTLETIKADLDEKVMGYVIYYHGLTVHPDGSKVVTQTASIFAHTEFELESGIEEAREKGWSAWIVGTMEDIPAAYLYKEFEDDFARCQQYYKGIEK